MAREAAREARHEAQAANDTARWLERLAADPDDDTTEAEAETARSAATEAQAEAETARSAATEAQADGSTWQQVCEALTVEGHAPARGGAWSITQARRAVGTVDLDAQAAAAGAER